HHGGAAAGARERAGARGTVGQGERGGMSRELNGRTRGERATTGEGERGRVGAEINGRTRGNRATTGQGERGRVGEDINGRTRRGASTTGQAPSERSTNRNANTNANVNANTNVNANVRLNAGQRSRIHSAIFANRSITRLSRADFDVRVNAVVPRHVHLVAVPADVVRIYPRFRRD